MQHSLTPDSLLCIVLPSSQSGVWPHVLLVCCAVRPLRWPRRISFLSWSLPFAWQWHSRC